MTVFVAGATGATGRLLVEQLLDRGQAVRAVVRSPEKLPRETRANPGLSLTRAAILDLGRRELAALVRGCDAVASCLGHTVSWKGLYGRPRRLVTEATRRLCRAIEAHRPAGPVRFVLMNTAANRNRDLREPVSPAQRVVTGLLRLLLPPHADNERAADVLRVDIGHVGRAVAWAAVRPDTLVDAPRVSPYEVHASPTRSAIFNAGVTSRVNVAHFMAELMTADDTWRRWKGRMPVIYNREGARRGSPGRGRGHRRQ